MEEITNRLREIIEADEGKRNGQKISQYEREDLELVVNANTVIPTKIGVKTP